MAATPDKSKFYRPKSPPGIGEACWSSRLSPTKRTCFADMRQSFKMTKTPFQVWFGLVCGRADYGRKIFGQIKIIKYRQG